MLAGYDIMIISNINKVNNILYLLCNRTMDFHSVNTHSAVKRWGWASIPMS